MIARVASFCLATVLVASPAIADMSGASGGSSGDGGDNEMLAAARSDIESGRYEAAIERLQELETSQPEDADVYNLLGYAYRKLERYQRAERYYREALELEPEHRGANEYLGQLYLETGRPDKARERLRVLDDACTFGCEEYDELRAAIRDHEGG